MNKERIYRNRYLLIVSILILLGISLFFFMININTPMMGEDFALISFYPYNEPSSILERISFIIKRIIQQACGWNIRIGEQISIIFGSINIIYFYIGNTIISILYVLLIPIYAFGRKMKLTERDDVISIVMSFCLIILFQPVLGEIFFWRTGSGNYLWAVFILLVFTIPLRMIIANKNIFENKRAFSIVHTLLGFLAGLTNENTVITFLIIYVYVIIYRIKKKQEIYLWIWSSFISLGVGFLVMIFAPSTAIRMQTYKKIFGIGNVTIIDYIHRALNVIKIFFTENAYLVIILLMILVIYTVLNYKEVKAEMQKKELNIYKIAGINISLLLASALSAGALIGAPYVETRAFFLVDFFMMGCIVYFGIQLINGTNKIFKLIIFALIGVIMICTLKENIVIYNTYRDYNSFIENNYNRIKEAKTNKEESVRISLYDYKNNRILNTREDYLQSNLKYLEGYFGIKVIYSMKDIYSIDESQLDAQYIDIMNGMDYIDYKSDGNELKIIGWAAIKDKYSPKSNISILLKSDSRTYKFNTDKVKRKDVSDFYNNSNYDDTGFSMDKSNLDSILEKGKYTIGICITDNNNNNYVMYTQKQIEIN